MSKEFFNSKAATWDTTSTEKDISKLKNMLDRLDIRPGESVLDVGSGTGILVPLLLKRIGQAGSLVCLDYAEEMLNVSRSKGFTGNMRYLCADIEDSGLVDGSFNVVVCYAVFPHIHNKPRAFREVYRLLKQDGRLYICHTSSRQALNEMHRGVREVCGDIFPENEETRRMLVSAGFADIEIADGQEDYLASAVKSTRPSS